MVKPMVWAGLLGVLLAAGVATGQDEKKKKARGVYGLPPVAQLKDKLQLSEEASGKIAALYEKAAEDFKKLRQEMKDGGDKKAVGQKIRSGRTALIAAVKECLDEEQKKKFDEMAPQRKKKGKKKLDN